MEINYELRSAIFFYECDQALKSTGELQLPHVWIGIEMGFLEMRIAIRADYD